MTRDGLYDRIEECPLCGSAASAVIREETNHFPKDKEWYIPYSRDPVLLKRCAACGFAFLDKLPRDPAYYEKLYASIQPGWRHEYEFHGKELIFEEIKGKILRYKKSGKLLDVGAYCGAFLKEMAGPFEAHGVELNPQGAGFARSQGFDVRTGSFRELDFPRDSFDVITFTDVLEHLPGPGEILKKATAMLRPEGLLYIKVPNYRGQIWKQDLLLRLGLSEEGIAQNYIHINHFCRSSLIRALRALGYEILESGGAPVEIWNLREPLPFRAKLRRFGLNLIRRTVSGIVNGTVRLVGSEWELNLFVLARKK